MKSRSGCLPRVAGIAAGLLVLLAVLTLPFALLGRSLEDGLSSDHLSTMVEERLISSGFLREVAARAIFQGSREGGLALEGVELPAAFEYLSPEDQQEIAGRLLPEEWFTEQIRDVVANTFTWLESDEVQPGWRIDFSPLRNNLLRGGGAASIAEIMISSWPDCTPEDARSVAAFLESGVQPEVLCEPPEPLRTQLLEEGTQLFRQLAENIPSEIMLGKQLSEGMDPARIQAMKEVVRAVRRLANAVFLLPLFFLGLIMALVIRSWSDLLRWWGAALGLGGVFGLLAALRLTRMVELQTGTLLGSMAGEATDLQNVLGEIVDGMSSLVLEGFALRSLIWAILGGIAFLIGWLLRRGFKRSPRRENLAEPSSLEHSLEGGRKKPPPSVDPLVRIEEEGPVDPPRGLYG